MERNSGIIIRDNLIRLFDSLKGERFIYICAPAGYGKTVAVRQWLDGAGGVKAIISLDRYDDSPARFCARFSTALLSCQPKNTALAQIVSHPAFDSAPDEFVLRAIAALSERKRATLVFDDLHFLSDERVLALLLIFLKRLPEAFRMLLISRNDLPAGFSDLWIRGQLARITANQFAFSGDEIMMLYKKRGNPVTPEQAGIVRRFTAGWAIGINALLISGGEPTGEKLEFLDDFIQANVWERWDETTREFMLKTATVSELTPPLCNALSGMRDCEVLLDRLVARNAFISREGKGKYRYHHLFQAFLQRKQEERGEEFIRIQCEKAGDWYLSHNDFYNALDYFIKAQNCDGIAKSFGLLSAADHEFFFIDKLLSVVNFSVIEESAEKSPYIYSTLLWAAFNEGRAEDMARYADLYYANQHKIVQYDPNLQLELVLVLLVDFRRNLRELPQAAGAIFHSSGMEVTEPDDIVVPTGIINQNLPLLHRGTRDFSECADGDAEANITEMKATFGGFFGEGASFLAECIVAGILYEQGQLEKAYSHALAANAEIKNHTSTESRFFAMSALVCIFDAMDQPDEAEQVIKRIDAMIEQNRAYYLSRNFKALIIRRKLERGDIEAAREWISMHESAQNESLSFHRIYEAFTTCRAYIAAGDYNSAIILLEKVRKLAHIYNRPLDIIEAGVLLSIAYWKKKRGFQEEGIRHLKDSVSLAHGFGYTQMFTNEGAELSGMLRRLQRSIEQCGEAEATPASFIKMLYLRTLENQHSGLTSGQAVQPIKYTDKQRTVMKLLCEGKSYREITEVMGVKLPTLRSHISLIYKKLDVTSETDAIRKIKSLDILGEM